MSVRDGGSCRLLPLDAENELLWVENPLAPSQNVAASAYAMVNVVAQWEDALQGLRRWTPSRLYPTPLSILLSRAGHDPALVAPVQAGPAPAMPVVWPGAAQGDPAGPMGPLQQLGGGANPLHPPQATPGASPAQAWSMPMSYSPGTEPLQAARAMQPPTQWPAEGVAPLSPARPGQGEEGEGTTGGASPGTVPAPRTRRRRSQPVRGYSPQGRAGREALLAVERRGGRWQGEEHKEDEDEDEIVEDKEVDGDDDEEDEEGEVISVASVTSGWSPSRRLAPGSGDGGSGGGEGDAAAGAADGRSGHRSRGHRSGDGRSSCRGGVRRGRERGGQAGEGAASQRGSSADSGSRSTGPGPSAKGGRGRGRRGGRGTGTGAGTGADPDAGGGRPGGKGGRGRGTRGGRSRGSRGRRGGGEGEGPPRP